MILQALLIFVTLTPKFSNYALSPVCAWLGMVRGKKETWERIWWPTKSDVRVYLVPVHPDGQPHFPERDFDTFWRTTSKLPAHNIMPDPTHYGAYGLRYMFFEMQVRISQDNYYILNGTINLWHWHRIYPDPLTKGQQAALRVNHRLLWTQSMFEKDQLLYIYFPPGQTSSDPMVVYVQLPKIAPKALSQVKVALASLTTVPKDFKTPKMLSNIGGSTS